MTNCDGTSEILSTVSGSISLNATLKVSSETKACEWYLNSTTPTANNLYLAVLDSISLSDNDKLEILKGDNKTVDTVITGKQLGSKIGVLFTQIAAKNVALIRLTLDTNDTSHVRKFDVTFNTNGRWDIVEKTERTYYIPLNPTAPTAGNPTQTFALSFNTNLNKALVLEYMLPTGTAPSAPAVSGVTLPAVRGEWDDIIIQSPDPKTPAVLTLNNFDYSSHRIVISTHLVTKECSGYKSITSGAGTTFNTPHPIDDGEEIECLWIAYADTKSDRLVVSYDGVKELLSQSDLIEISDGGSEQDSTLAEIRSGNLAVVKNDVSTRVTSKNAVRIHYMSPFVTDATQMVTILVQKATVSRVNPSDTVNLKADDTEKNPIFMTAAPLGQRAGFYLLTTGSVTQATLGFYSSNLLSDKPFMTVPKGRVVPDVIWSPTNILRIGLLDGTTSVSGKFAATNSSDVTSIGDSDSILLSNLTSGQEVRWLIPGREDNSVFNLAIHKLVLDVPESSISIKRISTEKDPVIFTASFDVKTNSVLNTKAFPEIELAGNYSYLLTYKRGKLTAPDVKSVLEATVSYAPQRLCGSEYQLDSSKNNSLILSPSSYPNNYRLVDPLLVTAASGNTCGWKLDATSNGIIHVSFDDLDLKDSQSLSLLSPLNNTVYKSSSPNSLPDDHLGQNITFIRLDSPLEKTPSNLNSVSGRGFRLRAEAVSCGGMLNIDENGSLVTPGYPNVTSVTRCIWLIKVSKPEQYSVLNFTMDYNLNSTDAKLEIYDNPNTRGHLMPLNSNYTVNGTYSSSLDQIIVSYTSVDGKKPLAPLRLNFTVESEFLSLKTDVMTINQRLFLKQTAKTIIYQRRFRSVAIIQIDV